MSTFDFLIIGAQKSATTSLFKYLEAHDDIAMPAAKEMPLFTDEVSETDIEAFFARELPGAEGRLAGKATPQYMCDERIPARIHAHNPRCKLIAVLRDPIERAWSQYRMNLRREHETRDFDTAAVALLEENALTRARAGSPPLHSERYEDEGDFYIAWSEYGRILERYVALFGRAQMLVLFMDELSERPEETLDRVLTFLSLRPGYRPSNLGEVAHRGGDGVIVPPAFKNSLRSFPPIAWLWDNVPGKHQGTIRYWYEQLNVRRTSRAYELSPFVESRLQTHFANDAELLHRMTGVSAPWLKRYASQDAKSQAREAIA